MYWISTLFSIIGCISNTQQTMVLAIYTWINMGKDNITLDTRNQTVDKKILVLLIHPIQYYYIHSTNDSYWFSHNKIHAWLFG